MRAIIYDSPGHFSLKQIEKPKPGPDDVIIKVKACGFCKTDLHIHHGRFISQFPLIPGHEFTGFIDEIGSEVEDFQVGDKVVADNTILCGHCYYCRKDQPLYCENFYSLGVTGPGGYAEFVKVKAEKTFKTKLDFLEAIFVEPTACAVHGMERINVKPGDDVVQFGAGPTGIILAQLIKHGGAGNLVVCDPNEFKLEKLKNCADQLIKVDRTNYEGHKKVLLADFPRGFDIVVEASGIPKMFEECHLFAKYGAKIIAYGVYPEDINITVNPYEIFRKELKFIGSFAQTHKFEAAIKMLEHGQVNVKDLVTHKFPLEQYQEALNVVQNTRDKIKVAIIFD
ncbi:MAG TPA: zinc-dependent alcohol dehydrogenase family protein [Candidatus Deferrimicrobium sp.]|nr:zinc-dependent alcohol dehydrogenase family protein [Candidatus Deferrimicrobium sp.]